MTIRAEESSCPLSSKTRWEPGRSVRRVSVRCSAVVNRAVRSLFHAGLLTHLWIGLIYANSPLYPVSSLGSPYVTDLHGVETHLFVATWGEGVYRRGRSALLWDAVNSGLENRLVYTLASHKERLFAGTGGAGLYFSDSFGDQWRPRGVALRRFHLFSIGVAGDTILAGTWQNGLFRSVDGGVTFTPVSGELRTRVAYTILRDTNRFYLGTSASGIYQSDDNGRTWRHIGLAGKSIVSLTAAQGRIYAGTWHHGLFQQEPDGAWTNLGYSREPIKTLYVKDSLIVSAFHAKGLFAATPETGNRRMLSALDCEGTSLYLFKDFFYVGTWGCGLYYMPRGALYQNDRQKKPVVAVTATTRSLPDAPAEYPLQPGEPTLCDSPLTEKNPALFHPPVEQCGSRGEDRYRIRYVAGDRQDLVFMLFDRFGKRVITCLPESTSHDTIRSTILRTGNVPRGIYLLSLDKKTSRPSLPLAIL